MILLASGSSAQKFCSVEIHSVQICSVCVDTNKIRLFQLLSAVYTCIHPRMVVSER